MDVGTLLSAVQTLFASLQCLELRELCDILGYKKELQNLERTVNTVKAVLLDAEAKHVQVELSHQVSLWFQELKDVVYDADDLIDEFVTLAKQRKLIKGSNVSKKVRFLLCRCNSLAIARKTSQGIKEIRKRLDAIASNHNQFGFKLDCQPIRRRREETCSYVHAHDIVGRGDDVENIVARLLDTNVSRDVSCLTIVGIGGLGKTTLAQLVYNDPRIKENFPWRMWTCVADQDIKHLDVKTTLCKILQSATGNNHEHLSMDHLQRQLQDQLAGKKYLLVLDDVWNEVRYQWLEVEKFLISGLRGSWIVVTTRSEGTTIAVGDEHPYKLKGLSEEDSWCLFMKTTFEERSEQANPDLVGIGQDIVKRCANVPLAIRVAGTLLYGQGKEKWLWLKDVGLGRVKQGEKGIKPILKLSYDHLESPLKTCFNYCALFPKDFEIEKERLINLWIAQGYVVPLDEGQSIEDASGEYFSILLKRCFFRDIRKDKYGEIISCKIHDLMHDIAQEVAGKDIHAAVHVSSGLNNEVRHLSYSHFSVDMKNSFIGLKIRTCLRIADIHLSPYQYSYKSDSFTLLASWTCLRALDLSDLGIKNLPNAMGRLIHLRYLDLSYNPDLEMLPDSTTKLHNLETLRLVACRKFRELPRDLSKLTKLRVLDTSYCWGLALMPRRMGRLRCLQKLPLLVLDGTSHEWGLADQLEEIKPLKNIKGDLFIKVRVHADAWYVSSNGQRGGYLSEHQFVTKITFGFPSSFFDVALLEDLQPHPNLKDLKLEGYCGERMPYWARADNLAIVLPNLVSVCLQSCHKLQHLPVLGKLPKLELLRLEDLPDLEYIEDTIMGRHSSVVGAWESEESFFPCLEELELWGLPKLKGWWRDDSNTNRRHGLLLPSIPRVSHLRIEYCPNLACMPLCPSIEVLTMVHCNANLQIVQIIESGNSRLRSVETDRVGHLELSQPMESFQHLNQMYVWSDKEVENLSDVEMFRSCSSSLQTLKIWNWYKLKSVCGGLERLTALQKLELRNLPNLSLNKAGEEEDDDGMPWHCLRHCLRSLELSELPKLVNLPNGMRYLTAVQSLHIEACGELESMPEWMPELTSLKQLIILDCSDSLTERCHNCTGEDWPNIQHIRHVQIH